MCFNLQEEVENITEEKCPPLTHLRDVCFPVRSVDCEDIRSACVLYESLNVSVTWLKDLGHMELMCWTQLVRSYFKTTRIIATASCESHQPHLNDIKSVFVQKCVQLEILSKLKKWLRGYLTNPKPEPVSHPVKL